MTEHETYTHGHHDSVLRSQRWRTAENSAAYLLPLLAPGMELLDVGCGPGTITVDLARRVAPGRVIGVDREEAVLAEARAVAARQAHVAFMTGDVYALDFEDGRFDVVHAHQVLQHLTDPVAALVEMGRVCRPGGLVAVRDADMAAMTWYPAEPALDEWMRVYHEVARANGAEPDAGRRLVAWARQAGLTDLTASAGVWCFASADERAWWAGLWAERVTSSRLADHVRDYGLATSGELRQVAEGLRRWADQPDGWFAVLHGEILCRTPAPADRPPHA